MSHYIIIGGKKVFIPHEWPRAGGDVQVQHTEHTDDGSTIEYSVTYTPSHSIPAEQVRKNVAKMQRICARFEDLEGEGE